jgi:dihydropteroate synthase
MNTAVRKPALWQLRTRALELGRRTLVMGIVNITPDSFSDGGFFFAPEAAVAHALQLLDEGAGILDLGAESTRPGSSAGGAAGSALAPAVSAEEEQARLLPVLEGILAARPEAIVSVDTYKAATARAALAAGAEIINDVSGFQWDSGIAAVCAESRCGVVLMHTRGRPDEWRLQAQLAPDALLTAVRAGLSASLDAAAGAGIPPESIVLDPGYGFGKRFDENYALLARQAELLSLGRPLGRPLLVGLSRKSFLGHTLLEHALAQLGHDPHPSGKTTAGEMPPASARETASLAALVAAILQGASIVRVHAVRPAVEAALIADAVLEAGSAG